jgi:tetratricopeptide (TPR) repeat protein
VYEQLTRALESELGGELVAASEHARVAVRLARNANDIPARMRAHYRLGHILGQMGKARAEDALAHLEQSAALARDMGLAREQAESLVYTAKVLADDVRDVQRARAFLERVWPSLASNSGEPPLHGSRRQLLLFADSLEARGLVEHTAGEYEQAVHWHELAYQVRHLLAGSDQTLDVTKSLNNLANSLSRTANGSAEALRLYERVLRVRSALLGDEHYLVGKLHYNLGVELSGRDGAKARRHLRQALAIRERTVGRHTSPVAEVWLALGVLAHGDGDGPLLEDACEQLRLIHTELPPEAMSQAVRVPELQLQAECAVRAGQTGQAIERLQRAVAILAPIADTAAEHSEDLAWIHGRLGSLYLSVGDHGPACVSLSTALASLDKRGIPASDRDLVEMRAQHDRRCR